MTSKSSDNDYDDANVDDKDTIHDISDDANHMRVRIYVYIYICIYVERERFIDR